MTRLLDAYRDPTEPGINLDGFVDADEAWGVYETIRRRPLRCARELFPGRERGYVAATRSLGHYAANKGTAMRCRLRGDIQAALVYEHICEDIYSRLPEFARW